MYFSHVSSHTHVSRKTLIKSAVSEAKAINTVELWMTAANAITITTSYRIHSHL